MILKEYGKDVRALMKSDPNTKYKVVVAVFTQVWLSYMLQEASWPILCVMAWSIGGMINDAMQLAMHEVSHNLAFPGVPANKLFGLFTNLPLGFPAFAQFKRYHRDHHTYQGQDQIDTDMPTEIEIWFFRNTILKVIWVFCQPLFYGFRPNVVLPKAPKIEELHNWVSQVAFDVAIFYFFGVKGIAYILLSTLLGMGFHPCAGHFIAEHYTFIEGQETYSYYGPLNLISFNVGYHNEHHDFPRIPGSKLPELRRIAAKYYEPLPYHTSWWSVILNYCQDPLVGPYSRVKRDELTAAQKAKVIADL